jgi:uncharacterized LabA/DUF88 family protein
LRGSAFSMSTNIYIDGFNLYHGRVKGTPYKWLDLDAMCRRLLPNHIINRIRYFTARVIGFPHDQGAPQRQDLYLRALTTLPNVSIHSNAFFSAHPIILPQFPLAFRNPTMPPDKPPLMVQVQRYEEKQTDVDIAVSLLLDCFANDADEYVLISNDSDLVTPVQTVRDHFGRTIGVINPHSPKRMSGHLAKAASYYVRTINKSVVRSSQLPLSLTDSNGVFSKPASW